MSEKRVRLTLDCTPPVYARIAKLSAQMEAASLSECLRRALSLAEVLVDAKDRGERVVFESDSGSREVLVV